MWRRKSDEENRHFLTQMFETTLDEKVDRRGEARVHQAIPGQWFAAASRECRGMYVEGHYYGCISVAQAVAEGISRYVTERNGMKAHKSHAPRVAILRKKEMISEDTLKAFRIIEGRDRHHFHHFNSEVETDRQKLKARALECVEALYLMESDLFEFKVLDEGKMGVTNPRYWDKKDGKYWVTYIDFT